MSLKGKVAVITGAASGIGFETVKAFLNADALGITLVDRSMASLQAASKLLNEEEHGRILMVEADVSNEVRKKHCPLLARAQTASPLTNKQAATQRYIRETVERFGHLDISAQIAGVSQRQSPVEDLSEEEFDKVLSVNVKGPFLGVKHSVKAMKASPSAGKGCSIIVCGSQLGLDGHPNLTAYSASKFAVRGITQSSAAELGPCGIRVNTVCPGPIETPMLLETPRDQCYKLAGTAMLHRLGKPEEIAQAILFLASDQSAYVTGSSLKVDGGFSRFA